MLDRVDAAIVQENRIKISRYGIRFFEQRAGHRPARMRTCVDTLEEEFSVKRGTFKARNFTFSLSTPLTAGIDRANVL